MELENYVENEQYDYEPLDIKWQTKLMSDRYYIKDCIGDGNCQFRSIANAMNCKTSHINLRRVLAKSISKMAMVEFYRILDNYKIEKQNGEFLGKWNPSTLKTKKEFIEHITKTGFHFEGDNITLGLLSKSLGVDFVIFDNTYRITDLSNPDSMNDKIILLYFESFGNSGHYKTIGINRKGNKQCTVFKRSNLPSELELILDKDKFMTEHVRNAYHTLTRVTINSILAVIQTRLISKIWKEEKRRLIYQIIKLLDSEKFFDRKNKTESQTRTLKVKC